MRRHVRAALSSVLTAAVVVSGGVLAAPAAADEVVGDENVLTTEVSLDGVDETALDTLELPTEDPATGDLVDPGTAAGDDTAEPDDATGQSEPDGSEEATDPDASDDTDHAAEPEDGDAEPDLSPFAAPAPDSDENLAVLSREQSTDPFDLVGVTWADAEAPVERVLVRVRQAGEWTGWHELEVAVEGPEAGTPEAEGARPGTDPLIRPDSDGVQVRVDTTDGSVPADLALTLVDGGGTSTSLEVETAADVRSRSASPVVVSDVAGAVVPAVAGASPARLAPRIVRRSQWGADESIRKSIDYSSTIQAVIVHHTVNANNYSRAQAPAVVRSIYAYHVKSRGWSDVGYHFLVDRFGTVYEGRKGSIDRIPLGVQTGGFNTNTFGVAVIGDYRSASPSSAAVSSVAQVAAWKLAEFGRDPLGTTRLTARSGSTKQKPGWSGSMPVILGHRDVGSTTCPGPRLYSQLSNIRKKAADQISRTVLRPATVAAVNTDLGGRFYGGSGASWRATVTSACASSPTSVRTGTGSRWVKVGWKHTTSSGARAKPGVYALDVQRTVGSRTVTDRTWVESLPPPSGAGAASCGYSRWGGKDRYATAAALGGAAFPRSSEVVLVAGAPRSVVDGLVAAPFARARKAPVLLSGTDSLPPATLADIKRRTPSTVWLVGGTGVLSTRLESQLRGLGVKTITRLAGADRYGTAEAIAERMGGARAVIVASGAPANLIDSAAVSGVGAATGRPVLLTQPGGLSSSTRSLLSSRRVDVVTVVGGTGAVSGAVVSQLRNATGARVTRLGGDDRYDTALAVANAFASTVGTDRVMIAASADRNLVDSMTGGVHGRLTLLVPGSVSHPDVNAWLARRGTTKVDLAGGSGVISPTAVAQLIKAYR